MSQKKLLGLLGAMALVAFAAGCSSKECSVDKDCASKGANFACVNNACLEQAPKTCSPTCSGSTPVCNTATLTCVACTQNSDCSGATPTCDTTSNTCVGCLSNANCSGATPVCDTTAKTCVGCTQNADCGGTTPVCDSTSHSCVSCTQNSECSGSTPICDTANHTCTASCTTDAECAATAPSTPRCDTSANVCVACLGNADCAANSSTPACNSSTHTCVECAANADCSGNVNGGVCNTTTNSCVQCLAQADCTNAATPSCNTTTNTCAAACASQTDCTISQDCTDGGPGKYCTDVNVTAASDAITTVKTTSLSGPVAVNGAIVTYLKPSVSGDQAGFFVQAEAAGPALFVGIDPATLTPAPKVGDRVAFNVTTVDSTVAIVTVTAIDGWQVFSSGHDVALLRTDVSAATDLVTALTTAAGDPTANPPVPAQPGYESRLISLSFTVTSLASANTGYGSALITTAGYPSGDAKLKFYAPATVFSDDDLTAGCVAQITNGVMDRYYTTAEPAVWADTELTVSSCPAPKVLSASRPSATEVDVTFDRNINPTTATVAGFTITETANPANVLAVTAAAVSATNPHVVILTTASQTQGTKYTVTVNPTVQDDRGASVDSTANTATFSGYAPPAVVRITEFNPNISATNGADLIELAVTSGGSLAGMQVIDSAYATPKVYASLPDMVVATGDVILIHAGVASTACTEANQTKGFCPAASNKSYNDNAWDFTGTTAISWSAGQVITLQDSSGNLLDGVPFSKAGTGTVAGNFLTAYQALVTANLWGPTAADDATAQAQSVQTLGVGTSSTGNSVRRDNANQPGGQADWGTVSTITGGTSQARASDWGVFP